MLKAAFRSVEIAFTFVYRTVIFVQDGGKSVIKWEFSLRHGLHGFHRLKVISSTNDKSNP